MSETFVFIGGSWCAPCKAAWPIAERVATELGTEVEYVDVEEYDSRAHGVTTIPTLRVFDEDENLIREHRGGMNEAQIRALFADK